MLLIIMAIFTYLISSVSTAIIVSKAMQLPDPRTQGSNNPGATNVLRIGGKKAAAFVFVGDALKGFIPVLIAKLLGIEGFGLGIIAWIAVLGHIFPLYYQFKGGKGVATAIGSIMALSPLLGLFFIAIWLLMAYGLRYSSLSALTAAVLMPVLAFFSGDTAYILPLVLIAITLLFTHRSNIQRLRKGVEPQIK